MSDKSRMRPEIPRDPVTSTTPLRLEVAAKIAFPDGSMKLAGLRREIARGRLSYEIIAGKHYTTLSDIDEMRRLCRVQANAPGAASSRRASSAMPAHMTDFQQMSLQELLARRLEASRLERQKRKAAKSAEVKRAKGK